MKTYRASNLKSTIKLHTDVEERPKMLTINFVLEQPSFLNGLYLKIIFLEFVPFSQILSHMKIETNSTMEMNSNKTKGWRAIGTVRMESDETDFKTKSKCLNCCGERVWQRRHKQKRELRLIRSFWFSHKLE